MFFFLCCFWLLVSVCVCVCGGWSWGGVGGGGGGGAPSGTPLMIPIYLD